MTYETVVPAGVPVTHFACRHPYSQRRRYDGIEVCRECCDARTQGGYWDATCRLHFPDGSLRTLGGEILYRDWQVSRTLG